MSVTPPFLPLCSQGSIRLCSKENIIIKRGLRCTFIDTVSAFEAEVILEVIASLLRFIKRDMKHRMLSDWPWDQWTEEPRQEPRSPDPQSVLFLFFFCNLQLAPICRCVRTGVGLRVCMYECMWENVCESMWEIVCVFICMFEPFERVRQQALGRTKYVSVYFLRKEYCLT